MAQKDAPLVKLALGEHTNMKNMYRITLVLIWPSIAIAQGGFIIPRSTLSAIAVLNEIQYCGQLYPEYKSERDNFLARLNTEISEMMRNNNYMDAVLADELLHRTDDWTRPVARDVCSRIIYEPYYLQLIKDQFIEEQADIENRKNHLKREAARQNAPGDAPKLADP